MKMLVGLLVVLSLACAPTAFAAKRDKFGADKRHEAVKKEMRSIKPSTEKFKWKMVMPWTKGLLFYPDYCPDNLDILPTGYYLFTRLVLRPIIADEAENFRV